MDSICDFSRFFSFLEMKSTEQNLTTYENLKSIIRLIRIQPYIASNIGEQGITECALTLSQIGRFEMTYIIK